MTESVPVALGVMLTEHVAVSPVPDRVHDPLGVKVTVPVGVDPVPTSVSVTVAVHDVAWLTTTVDGLHATVVEVDRLLTVTVVAALVLEA